MKKGGKKEKERKEKDCGLQIVSPCFFFFFGGGRKLQEKYSTWKIKVTGERISLSLSLLFLKGKRRIFLFYDGGRTAGGVKFIRSFNGMYSI